MNLQNRELKTRPIYDCRCDERLKPKAEESTRLAYTGLLEEVEHKDKDEVNREMFAQDLFIIKSIKESKDYWVFIKAANKELAVS